MQRVSMKSKIGFGRRLAVIFAIAAILIACSDETEPTNPGPLPVASVAVTPQADEVPAGQTLQLTATALAANGDTLRNRQITWSSGNENVATVSASGLVTARASGIAVINAVSESKAGTAAITVVNPAPAITAISPATIQAGSPAFLLTVTGANFVAGSTVYFNGFARPTVYVSPTELRASIGAPDVESSGNAAIRVSTPLPGGGQSGNVALVITAGTHEVAMVEVSPPHATLWLGESIQLTATPRDAQGRPIGNATIAWQTGNASVLAAGPTGLITGIAAGGAAIEASVAGKRGYSSINVWAMQSTYDVVFEAYDGNHLNLFVVSPGVSTTPRRLLPAGTFAMQPAVSLDGNRVAFVGWDATTGNYDIFVVDRDGSNLRRVTTDAAPDERPAWSPDGSRLAFQSFRNGYRDIYVINVDGTNEQNLTAEQIRVGVPLHANPSWSPDGGTIVYTQRDASVHGSRTRIIAMNADGSNKRALTPVDAYNYVEPSFSRDGTMIVFRRNHAQLGDQIAVIKPNGEPLYWFYEPGHGLQPKWAPNGQWLTFVSGEHSSQPTDIYVWKLGEQGRKRVTLTGGASNPAWIRR